MAIISNEKVVLILDDQINRYIEICILFDTFFSIARTPCGEMDDSKLNNFNEIITLCMLKWRNLRLSMKMIKIHGIEDHLFDQIKKFNGIGCFIEDFIEQAHQFESLDEKRTGKLRDRSKAFQSYSTNEQIGLNGCVRKRIVEVNDNSKRKRNGTNIFLTKKKLRKSERIVERKNCLKTASSCNMDIVDDLTLRKRNQLN